MKRWLAAGLMLAATPLALAVAQGQTQMQTNWNVDYVATEQGHRVGNPAARVKLITFVSYSCPHCATFEVESDAGMRALYIHSGQVSVEVRHLIRNEVDVAAALITECGPEENFFDNHRAIMMSQANWLATAQSLSPTQLARWRGGSVAARMRAIASDLDFHELMEPRGYSYTEIDRCLADETRAREILALSQANAAEYNVPGTPSFVLNGQLLDSVHSWPALQTALDTALNATAGSTQ